MSNPTSAQVAHHIPTTFHLFPNFPIEIRLVVWKFARPAPRFLKLLCRSPHSPKIKDTRLLVHPTGGPPERHDITSTAKVPSLLHASHESRELALKWYRLSFAAQRYPDDLSESQPTVYFDWAADGLFGEDPRSFTPSHQCGPCQLCLKQEESNSITRLLLPDSLYRWDIVIEFPGLEELYLLGNDIHYTVTRTLEGGDLRKMTEESYGSVDIFKEYTRWFDSEIKRRRKTEKQKNAALRKIERVEVLGDVGSPPPSSFSTFGPW